MGAGVGVGMLRGGVGFLVSWFLRFSNYWVLGFLLNLWVFFSFLGFLMSKFLGFKVSWLRGFIKVAMIPYYQDYISCFLGDLDPIFEVFKVLLDGSSRFVGARFFGIFKLFDVQNFDVSKNNIC